MPPSPTNRPPFALRRSTTTLFVYGALISAWLCCSLPVVSQEAYYWTYAQHLDLCYHDHPPMVAWLIWLGTTLLGDGAVGVRLGTWSSGLLTAWSGLALLRSFGVGPTGERFWLLCSFGTPALLLTRFLANPDPPLVASFAVALVALWRARDGRLGWWLLAGLSAGCALLSKYSGAFLAVTGALLLLFDPSYRRQLLRPGPWLGVLVAAAVFLPVVVWNVQHEFISFRFQTQERFFHARLGLGWLGELLATQFGMLHPLVALLLPAALLWLMRRHGDARVRFLLAAALPLPAYMVSQSLWIHVKANWLTPAYVPLLLGLSLWVAESGASLARGRLMRLAVLGVCALQLLLPLAPLLRFVRPTAGTSWTGWHEVALRTARLSAELAAGTGGRADVFVFALDYRDAAQLDRNLTMIARSGEFAQDLPRVLAQNVIGVSGLQYDHWTYAPAHVGQNAILVMPRPKDRSKAFRLVQSRFEKVELAEQVEIRYGGVHTWDVELYRCITYRGPR